MALRDAAVLAEVGPTFAALSAAWCLSAGDEVTFGNVRDVRAGCDNRADPFVPADARGKSPTFDVCMHVASAHTASLDSENDFFSGGCRFVKFDQLERVFASNESCSHVQSSRGPSRRKVSHAPPHAVFPVGA